MQRANLIRCAGCKRKRPGYDIISSFDEQNAPRQLCTRCHNTEVARQERLEGFEHIQFDPMTLADSAGNSHEFHFRARLFGPGVALDAFEILDGYPGGYQFQVIGNPQDDQMILLSLLIARMRRALARQHLVDGEDGRLTLADHRTVRGRIAWDDATEGQQPLLIVDGRPISWEYLGQLLMTYEGFQVKITIADKSEEI